MITCKRKSIDGNKCLGGAIVGSYYRGITICDLCYKELNLKAKRLNYLNKIYAASDLKCKKCGKTMSTRGQHNTGYCKECLKDRELFCQVLKNVRKIYK